MNQMRPPRPHSPNALNAMTDLVFAWDAVRHASGALRGKAIDGLRTATERAASVEDLAPLKAPEDLYRAAVGVVKVWLGATDNARDGRLANAVEAVLGALWSWHAGTIEQPWPLNAQRRRHHHETEGDVA